MSENVQIKRKVTLKEKHSDTSDKGIVGQTPKKWPKILIPILIIAVAAVAAIAFWPKVDKGNDEQIVQNETEKFQSTEDDNSVGDNAIKVEHDECGEQVSENESAPEDASETPKVSETTPEKPNVVQPADNTSRTVNSKPQPTHNTTSIASHVSGTLTGDVEQDAKAVIRGEFGNGANRKAALGNRYQKIQDKVNEIYRNK